MRDSNPQVLADGSFQDYCVTITLILRIFYITVLQPGLVSHVQVGYRLYVRKYFSDSFSSSVVQRMRDDSFIWYTLLTDTVRCPMVICLNIRMRSGLSSKMKVFMLFFYGASGEIRTRTGLPHQILSLERLPTPPPRLTRGTTIDDYYAIYHQVYW